MIGADGIAAASALLGSALWQATVLVAAAALLARWNRGAAARAAIWTATLILTLVVPLASMGLPKYVWDFASSTTVTRTLAGGAHNGVPGQASVWWQQLALALWGVGVAVGGVRLALAWVTTTRLVRMSQPMGTRVPEHLLEPKAWRRPIALHSLPGLLSPFCWQFRRTVLVLPTAVQDFPKDELEMVLRHELVHLRRQDPLWLFLERVAAVLYWYHPAVWWAVRQASKYREFACDDAAIREPAFTAPYLRCIDRIVRARPQPPRHAAAVLGLGWERKLLVLRLRRLTGSTPSGRCAVTLGRTLLGGLLLAAVAAALVVVRFGPAPFAHARSGWTKWPGYTARCLQAIGLPARDFELDAHRLDPREQAAEHVSAHRRRSQFSARPHSRADD